MWGSWEDEYDYDDEWWSEDDYWLALAKAKPQTNSSGNFKTGFAVGCAAGAVATMGAIFALKSRSKIDDFQRA